MSYLDTNSVYSDLDETEPELSESLLSEIMDDEQIFYFYNLDNFTRLFPLDDNEDIFNKCFPFNSKGKRTLSVVDSGQLNFIKIIGSSKSIRIKKTLLTNIQHIAVLPSQNTLIPIFNNTPMSEDIPFSHYNDIQGGDHIYKIYKPIIYRPSQQYNPIVSREKLEDWCNYNNIEIVQNEEKGGIQFEKGYNNKILLSFRLKLGETPVNKYMSGKIYNINKNPETDLIESVNVIRNAKIHTEINRVYTNHLLETEIPLNDLTPDQEVYFNKMVKVYANMQLYNSNADGKTLISVQINLIQTLPCIIEKCTPSFSLFMDKINTFIRTYIYADHYYTNKFIISYGNLNLPILSNYNIDDYRTAYHFTIRSRTPCIATFERANGEKGMDDLIRRKFITIVNYLNPIVQLDDSLVSFKIDDPVLYLKNESDRFMNPPNLHPNETNIPGTIIKINGDNTFNIHLSVINHTLVNVPYIEIKTQDNHSLVLNFRNSHTHTNKKNQVVVDYTNRYNREEGSVLSRNIIDCFIIGNQSKSHIDNIHDIIYFIINFISFSQNRKTLGKFFESKYFEQNCPEQLKLLIVKPETPKKISPNIQVHEEATLDEDEDEETDDELSSDSGDSDTDEDSDEDMDLTAYLAVEGTKDKETAVQEVVAPIIPIVDLVTSKNTKERYLLISDKKDDYATKVTLKENIKKAKKEPLFLKRLYKYDSTLFNWKSKKKRSFTTICQAGRQPKVLSLEEKQQIDERDTKLNNKSYGLKSKDTNCEYNSKTSSSEQGILINGISLEEYIKSTRRALEQDVQSGYIRNWYYIKEDGSNSVQLSNKEICNKFSKPNHILNPHLIIYPIVRRARPKPGVKSKGTIKTINQMQKTNTIINKKNIIIEKTYPLGFPWLSMSICKQIIFNDSDTGNKDAIFQELSNVIKNTSLLQTFTQKVSEVLNSDDTLSFSEFYKLYETFMQRSGIYAQELCKINFDNDGETILMNTEDEFLGALKGTGKKPKHSLKCKAIKYGSTKDTQNWYICPRIYDKTTNAPLHYSSLIYNQPDPKVNLEPYENGLLFSSIDYNDEDKWRIDRRTGFDITTFKPMYKGADGTESSRNVWIVPRKATGSAKNHFYPGFMSSNSHPRSEELISQGEDPIYPLCCFRDWSKRFNELLDIKTLKSHDLTSHLHEAPKSKRIFYSFLSENSRGLLPRELDRLFQQTQIKKIIKSKVDDSRKGVFLRYGIKQGNESFLNLIAHIYHLTLKETKDKLIQSIVNADNTKALYFRNINNGFLELMFRKKGASDSTHSSYQNFIEYILSDSYKRYDLLYDICTSHKSKFCQDLGINGMCLIIFDISQFNKNFDYKIICPYFSKNILQSYQKEGLYKHVSFAIKYSQAGEDIYEPIYFSDLPINTSKGHKRRLQIDNKKYKTYINKIVHQFKSQCNEHPDRYLDTSIITFEMIASLMIEKPDEFTSDLKPVQLKKDGSNKIFGVQLQNGTILPIQPEIIDYDDLVLYNTSAPNVFNDLISKDTRFVAGVTSNLKEESFIRTSIDIHKATYAKLSNISNNKINISIIKYFGRVKEQKSEGIDLELKGFVSSYISNLHSYGIDTRNTYIYIDCNASEQDELYQLNEIIYDYSYIDRKLLEEDEDSYRISYLEPPDISILMTDLKTTDFKIKIGFIYSDKLVLIKTNNNLLIPIQPIEPSELYEFYSVDYSQESYYTSESELTGPIINDHIYIDSEHIPLYLKNLEILSRVCHFRLPVFIKGFQLDYESHAIAIGEDEDEIPPIYVDNIYLESGVKIGDSITICKIKCNPKFPVNTMTTDREERKIYLINYIKQLNIQYLTERDIVVDNLDIHLTENVKLSKFDYDLNIYEALVQRVNYFFTTEDHQIIKKTIVFINSLLNNKIIHNLDKLHMLLPLMTLVIDIVSNIKVINTSTLYPKINLKNLRDTLLVEHGVQYLQSYVDWARPIDDINLDYYLSKSYTFIYKSSEAGLLEHMPSNLLEKNAINISVCDRVIELYKDILTTYRHLNYNKLTIFNENPNTKELNRSDFLITKICENMIYNEDMQKQILYTYIPFESSNKRFSCVNENTELLFTQQDIINYDKLTKMYKLTESKYYENIILPTDQQSKPNHIYNFKYLPSKKKRKPYKYIFKII